LNQTQYSFHSRFEEGVGTNPEELIAAAHAGCFTMALSFRLSEGGFTPDELVTKCVLTFENGTITTSELSVTGKVPGITTEQFEELAGIAKENCPVSRVLNCEKKLTATLA
ncbi:MAG: OsmC family peroxiredoxin, partial [Chitinophagia bacterium]|nr:OsmC family peroxiredoxin [Chitinophagia bacterium]